MLKAQDLLNLQRELINLVLRIQNDPTLKETAQYIAKAIKSVQKELEVYKK